MRKGVQGWEKVHEEVLTRLNAAMRHIIEIAGTSAGQRVEVSRVGSGPLLTRKDLGSEWHALPPDLRTRLALRQDAKEILPVLAAPLSLGDERTSDTSSSGSST